MAASGAQFVKNAAAYVGTPYVWGGASPSKGFDCSGLVYYVLTKMGIRNVPRTSEEQYAWAQPIPEGKLHAGDLVFMNFPGETSPGHVMIYAGRNRVIQAPKPGGSVQVIQFTPKPPGSSEWGGTIVGYGRVPGLHQPKGRGDAPPTIFQTKTAHSGSPNLGGVTGALGGAAHDVASPFESAYGGITSGVDALKFLFSIRGLQVIGGGLLVLMGIYLLARQIGLAPTIGPITGAANAAADATTSASNSATNTIGPSSSPQPKPTKVVNQYYLEEPTSQRVKRRAADSAPSNEIPF